MVKGIIVVDVPENCRKCGFRNCSGYCHVAHKDVYLFGLREEKPDWCPIREVPKKSEVVPLSETSYVSGWNACIDEIMREEN